MFYFIVFDAYGNIDVTSITNSQYRELEHLSSDELLEEMEDFLKLRFGVDQDEVLWCGTQCKRPRYSLGHYVKIKK